MARYVLTGAPGSGKTAILRALEARGHDVVEESATDVIALELARGRERPWEAPGFTDDVVELQRERQRRCRDEAGRPTFYDRSPVCTLALCEFLGREPSATLLGEVERVVHEGVYDRTVLLVANLGFVVPTAARRISLEESIEFERCHVAAYRRYGYELVSVARGPLDERVATVEAVVADR